MEPLHFSTLKAMALSPAHFKHALNNPLEATRSMRVGTILHHLVLGGQPGVRLVCFDGTRRGKEWEAFKVANEDAEIMTSGEWQEAELMAASVRRDVPAMSLITGARYEVPLAWESCGLPRETRGLDIIGPGYIADLKSTQSAEPARFGRLAANLFYPEQLADYREACRANAIDAPVAYLIAVENKAPYPVTVHRMPSEVMDNALKRVVKWLESVRACTEADVWPGYAQSVLEFEMPAWADADEEPEEDLVFERGGAA